MADDEIALALVLVNFVSALWSYFCISASLDRRSRVYDLVHDTELAWHAFWTSCQVCFYPFPSFFHSRTPHLHPQVC